MATVHYYINPAGEAHRSSGSKGAWPAGSVLMKEKLTTDAVRDARTIAAVAGMIKGAPGSSPKTGDWQFFYFDNKSAGQHFAPNTPPSRRSGSRRRNSPPASTATPPADVITCSGDSKSRPGRRRSVFLPLQRQAGAVLSTGREDAAPKAAGKPPWPPTSRGDACVVTKLPSPFRSFVARPPSACDAAATSLLRSARSPAP
jgi:hypothetical protein